MEVDISINENNENKYNIINEIYEDNIEDYNETEKINENDYKNTNYIFELFDNINDIDNIINLLRM